VTGKPDQVLANLRSCAKQLPVQLELEEEKMTRPEPTLIDHADAGSPPRETQHAV
jgi:hypothetical protein